MTQFGPPTDDFLEKLCNNDPYLVIRMRELFEQSGLNTPEDIESINDNLDLLNSAPPEQLRNGRRVQSLVPVQDRRDLAGELSSDVGYLIDGQVDMKDQTIIVPEGGLSFLGYGFNASRLYSSEDNYTMFEKNGASYNGALIMRNFAIDVSGANSQVFNMDNQGNIDGIELVGMNFENCTDLGTLTDYRQIFGSAIGWINCDQGFTLEGTWTGLTILSSIALFFGASPVGFKLFEAGTGFSASGSIRADLNALTVPADFVFYDFDDTQVLADEGASLTNFRTTATNAIPNLPESNRKAYYKNCRGIADTYVGSSFTISAAVATVIGAVNTLVKMAGTTFYADEQHFDNAGDNAARYISTVPRSMAIKGSFSFTGTNNNEVAVQIRKWDDSAASYVNVGPEYKGTMNGGPAGTRAENVSYFGNTVMEENDRIEIWIKNLTAVNNITADVGGACFIEER